MEFGSVCDLTFTFFLLFVSLSLFSVFSYTLKIKASRSNLPPGRPGLPFIGESLEFLSTGQRGHPEKFIHDRMAKYSSRVFRTSILGESTAVFCGAAGNKFLFSNENKLVKAWFPSSVNKIFPSSTQTSSHQESKKMRNLVINFLKPEAIQRYVGMMDSIAQKHFESGWEGKQEVAVFPLAKRFSFLVACEVFLSIEDPENVAKFADLFSFLSSGIFSIPIDLPGTPFNRAIKVSKLLRKKLNGIIKKRKIDLSEKKASPMQDILSHMLLTADENGQQMNELDIADKILGLLLGGYHTVTTVITFVVKYLAEYPQIYHKVFTEQMEIVKSKASEELLNWEDIQKMRYTWSVACEVMRLAPPVQGTFREALNDFVYAGFTIPKGWKLYWSVNSTHRNPECFPEPKKFDPSRFEGNGPAPYTFVPFGGGPKMCPGKEYARLEILVFMHNIVKRYKWETLLPNEKIIVDPMPMPAKGLPIRLLPQTFA
ncbi:hypothetical protein CRYUN_Cryun34aG0098900 [Craigia yunnanensis]